jgi:hypothetical protein
MCKKISLLCEKVGVLCLKGVPLKAIKFSAGGYIRCLIWYVDVDSDLLKLIKNVGRVVMLYKSAERISANLPPLTFSFSQQVK